MRSDDDGVTWEDNIQLNAYRITDVLWRSGYYYATGYDWQGGLFQPQIWTSSDGADWQLIAGVLPSVLQRLVIHGDLVLMVEASLSRLLVVDGVSVSSYALPSPFRAVMLNGLMSVGADLYFVDAIGQIWVTSDFSNWTQYSYVPNAISLGYWPSQNCLVASDVGPTAKLWKIQL